MIDYNYEIIRSNRKTVAMVITPEGKIIIKAPFDASESYIKSLLSQREEFIRKKLGAYEDRDTEVERPAFTQEELERMEERCEKLIPVYVKKWSEVLQLYPSEVTCIYKKSSWGTCTSKKKLIFNTLIGAMPDKVMEDIVIHELCHLKYMNHSKDFYDLVYKCSPDYEESRRYIKKEGWVISLRYGRTLAKLQNR